VTAGREQDPEVLGAWLLERADALLRPHHDD